MSKRKTWRKRERGIIKRRNKYKDKKRNGDRKRE